MSGRRTPPFGGGVKAATPTKCPRCGAIFDCEIESGDCWCMKPDYKLPMPDSGEPACYCPKCLQEVASEKVAAELEAFKVKRP